MPLPTRITLEPLSSPVTASVTIPGSKSITNRALILAALGTGVSTIRGALWSEDTQVMAGALRQLGFDLTLAIDPEEPANRTVTVTGCGGRFPVDDRNSGIVDISVATAGTAARFLTAFLCLGRGTYRLHGTPRMHERPQAPLTQALRSLGYRIDSANDRLPALIHGSEARPGHIRVSVNESSQFASALLLASRNGRWEVEVEGDDDEETPYVEMTRRLVDTFPHAGGDFQVEPDASSGSYFIAARALGHDVEVKHWPQSGMQVDGEFPWFLPLPAELSRTRDLGDSIMTAIVLAPFADHPVQFTNLGRLRVQECERVLALRTELTKCGARVEEDGDTLIVYPSALHGAEIETYNDHRMAMCFAVVGMAVPAITLLDPSCVRKTFPNFFEKLAAPLPIGLGMRMVGPAGEFLGADDLSAD